VNCGTADQRWLSSMLPFVRGQLPAAPGRVIEIGCGPLGGFVPALAGDGYDSVGVDPEAPEGPDYHRIEFERYDAPGPADAVVACTSLHHVHDLDTVLDKVAAGLVAGGTIVVIEWAHERFDEATARWCFDRLGAAGSEEGWLHHHRDAWRMTGVDWDTYHTRWADEEALHTGAAILDALDARFRPVVVQGGPYFFPALGGTSAAVEQAAIDSDRIRPTGIRFVGRLR
jgi:SAM-dependent methyltransferase